MRKRLDTPECESLRDLGYRTGSSVRPKVETYRGRVLVVDDNDEARRVVSTMLGLEAFDVLVARDGEEALAFYAALHRAIDVVVLDVQMPGIDGTETFRRLRKLNPGVKAILCSGGGASSRVEQALRDGALAFLAKPFAPDDLVGLLVDAIGARDGSEPIAGNQNGDTRGQK